MLLKGFWLPVLVPSGPVVLWGEPLRVHRLLVSGVSCGSGSHWKQDHVSWFFSYNHTLQGGHPSSCLSVRLCRTPLCAGRTRAWRAMGPALTAPTHGAAGRESPRVRVSWGWAAVCPRCPARPQPCPSPPPLQLHCGASAPSGATETTHSRPPAHHALRQIPLCLRTTFLDAT